MTSSAHIIDHQLSVVYAIEEAKIKLDGLIRKILSQEISIQERKRQILHRIKPIMDELESYDKDFFKHINSYSSESGAARTIRTGFGFFNMNKKVIPGANRQLRSKHSDDLHNSLKVLFDELESILEAEETILRAEVQKEHFIDIKDKDADAEYLRLSNIRSDKTKTDYEEAFRLTERMLALHKREERLDHENLKIANAALMHTIESLKNLSAVMLALNKEHSFEGSDKVINHYREIDESLFSSFRHLFKVSNEQMHEVDKLCKIERLNHDLEAKTKIRIHALVRTDHRTEYLDRNLNHN